MAFSLNLEKINLNKTSVLKANDARINVNLEKNPDYSNYEEIDYNQDILETLNSKTVGSQLENPKIGDSAIVTIVANSEVKFNDIEKMWNDGTIDMISNNWISDLEEQSNNSYNNNQYIGEAFNSTKVQSVTEIFSTIPLSITDDLLTNTSASIVESVSSKLDMSRIISSKSISKPNKIMSNLEYGEAIITKNGVKTHASSKTSGLFKGVTPSVVDKFTSVTVTPALI